jgi:hypothetical protein
VDSLWNQGKHQEAIKASESAAKYCRWGIISTIVFIVINYIINIYIIRAPLKTQKGKRAACKCLRQDFLKPKMRLKWRIFWFFKTHLGTVHP